MTPDLSRRAAHAMQAPMIRTMPAADRLMLVDRIAAARVFSDLSTADQALLREAENQLGIG